MTKQRNYGQQKEKNVFCVQKYQTKSFLLVKIEFRVVFLKCHPSSKVTIHRNVVNYQSNYASLNMNKEIRGNI